jgi:uncharacterized protein (TIGR02452 family)
MEKEQLIKVWKDTESLFSEYPTPRIGSKISINLSKKVTKITVINEDCIEVARLLAERKDGKVCMLNMASYKHPGGGVKRGTMSQEEELARRSNLMHELSKFSYPLDIDELIYIEDVSFFKNKNYDVIPSFICDVISVPAINLNGVPRPDNYEEIMVAKIEAIFDEAYKAGCKHIVLSAFGCGVFKNDPAEVAKMFSQVIKSGSSKFFDTITFAIFDDKNSNGKNFETFKNEFSQQV